MSRREMLSWSFVRTFEQNTSEFEKASVGATCGIWQERQCKEMVCLVFITS